MKQKNSELPAHWLLAIFGVIMTAAIIIVVQLFYNQIRAPMIDITEKTAETVEEFQDYKITMYEDLDVQGSEVVNYIKEHLGDYMDTETGPFYIRVKTVFAGTSYTNDYTNKKYIKDIRNVSAVDKFIKPTAYYFCEVIRSQNKAILGVSFTQK